MEDKIQDYIRGRLAGADLQDFENTLKTDTDLAEQVRFFKNIERVMENKELFDLRQTIREVIVETPITPDFDLQNSDFNAADKNPASDIGNLKFRWGLSALAIVAALLAVLWFSNAPKRQAQAVAQQFTLEVYDNIFNIDDADNRSLAQAVRAYVQGNYAAAIPLFETHLKTAQEDTDAQFYLGLCLALTKDYNKALTPLQNVVNYNSRLAMDARWYLALCYLHLGEVELAKPLLTAIPRESLFGEKAEQVLGALQ